MENGSGRRWSGVDGGGNKTIINRILLGYRPIAPKPVVGGSGSSEIFKSVRTKRKYVRTKKNIVRCRKKTKKKVQKGEDGTVITRKLLPLVKDSPAGGSSAIYPVQELPILLDFDNNNNTIEDLRRSTTTTATATATASDLNDMTARESPVKPPESWVTVECVTETCMDGGWLGYSDMEKIRNLEMDTSPGFVSDGFSNVKWVNLAYRKMVLGEGYEKSSPLTIELAVKFHLPVLYPAFACRVRVQYTCRNVKCSQILPCDVWRMDFGGYAWRFDLKAALSLGR